MVTTVKEFDHQVEIPAGGRRLSGILRVPHAASAIVAFAHGSGSGRFSPRNQFVARALEAGGLAILLLDLLEEDEAEDRDKVFDIDLLAERLHYAADWLRREPATGELRLGYFGASTGAGPPWSLRRVIRTRSGRSFRAAGARTWPGRTWRPSGCRPC